MKDPKNQADVTVPHGLRSEIRYGSIGWVAAYICSLIIRKSVPLRELRETEFGAGIVTILWGHGLLCRSQVVFSKLQVPRLLMRSSPTRYAALLPWNYYTSIAW